MSAPIFRSLFARLSVASPVSPCVARATYFGISPATSSIIVPAISASPAAQWHQQSRSLHVTSAAQAKSFVPARGSKTQSKKKKKGKKGRGEGPDPRIVNLKSAMPRAVPSPLRFARNRALRHWTIHRAWLLYQRQERERQEYELQRYAFSPLPSHPPISYDSPSSHISWNFQPI